MVAIAIAIGSLAVGIAGAAVQYSQQKKAAKASERARALQQKQQNVAYRKSQVSNLRALQKAAARSQAVSTGFGSVGGSGFAGGRVGLGSGFGAASGFASQMSGLSQGISSFQQQAANYNSSAAGWGALSNLGFGVANTAFAYQPSSGSVPQGVPGGGGPSVLFQQQDVMRGGV
jgi:type II secretory pathway pseudopilin PulG